MENLKLKRLDVESIAGVLYHSQVRGNSSFLHSGVKRCLEEIDALKEILDYIRSGKCDNPAELADCALEGKDYGKGENS